MAGEMRAGMEKDIAARMKNKREEQEQKTMDMDKIIDRING